MSKRTHTAEPCPECGQPMRVTREPVPIIGLPSVTVQNAEVSRCPKCGDYEVAFERIEDLHRTIVAALIRKPNALTGDEVRFLRGWLGETSAELARRMDTAAVTLSRWEHGRQPIGGTSDRLLRLIVASQLGTPYPLPRLAEIGTERTPLRMSVQWIDGEWRIERRTAHALELQQA